MTEPQRLIVVSLVDLDGKAAVLFYDLVGQVVMDDPTDFFWSLSEVSQLDAKTISDSAYIVRRFLEYLACNGKTIGQCRDSDIAQFRDEELKSVMSSNKSKQKDRIAKNTVNIRVRLVYRFLAWLQANDRTPSHLIGGDGCRVRSSIPEEMIVGGALRPTFKAVSDTARMRALYPLAYRGIGTKSKHLTKYVPSEKTRFAAIAAIHDTASTDYLAHRNALIVDIANALGWRRESINSITYGQVLEAREALKKADFASMSPPRQKFGYVETFDVPGWLVERMNQFWRVYLEPMALAKGWKLSHSSPFFMSVNGSPLKERSITKLVSTAMRVAGAPRFTSVHALRRKFTNDAIEDETRHRIKEGLDTSAASIASSVSISLGHHAPDSIYAYVSRSMSSERTNIDSQRREHLAMLENQIVTLRAQVRDLECDLNSSIK